MRRYTKEEHEFIREIIPGHSHREIADEFNKKFEPITIEQVKSYIGNNKLNTGRTGRFDKGHTPANKGQKMSSFIYERCERTMFKPGNRPRNHRKVGSERLTADGYWEVKIAEPNVWKLKHRLAWEKLHGTIPKGHTVIFADQNRNNFNLDNLILISRAQLVRMNQNGLIKTEAEATKTGIIIADLITKTAEVRKVKKGRQ